MAIVLTSKSRYNGGAGIKRVYGSSTVTEFWVEVDGKLQPGTVKGYGATPSERKANALERFKTSVLVSVTDA